MKTVHAMQNHKRSASLWILIAGLSLFSIGGWLRLVMTLQDWAFIQTLNLKTGPFYLAVTGLLWGCGAVTCAVLLWLEKRWSIYLTVGFITLYSSWYWVDRLVIARSSTANTDLSFAIIATIFWLGLGGTLLYILFQRSRRYNDN